MRNRHPGDCYRCGQPVAVGDGHPERIGALWRVQHAGCAIRHRGEPDAPRNAYNHGKLLDRAKMTGKRGQRARQELGRQMAAIPTEEF